MSLFFLLLLSLLLLTYCLNCVTLTERGLILYLKPFSQKKKRGTRNEKREKKKCKSKWVVGEIKVCLCLAQSYGTVEFKFAVMLWVFSQYMYATTTLVFWSGVHLGDRGCLHMPKSPLFSSQNQCPLVAKTLQKLCKTYEILCGQALHGFHMGII